MCSGTACLAARDRAGELIKSLTIPSSCLVQRDGKGVGAVLVVRDGELKRVPIRVGLDNGIRVEVTSGLNENDHIVLQPDASIIDGTKGVSLGPSSLAPLDRGRVRRWIEPIIPCGVLVSRGWDDCGHGGSG